MCGGNNRYPTLLLAIKALASGEVKGAESVILTRYLRTDAQRNSSASFRGMSAARRERSMMIGTFGRTVARRKRSQSSDSAVPDYTASSYSFDNPAFSLGSQEEVDQHSYGSELETRLLSERYD
jgi:hypothetical protein